MTTKKESKFFYRRKPHHLLIELSFFAVLAAYWECDKTNTRMFICRWTNYRRRQLILNYLFVKEFSTTSTLGQHCGLNTDTAAIIESFTFTLAYSFPMAHSTFSFCRTTLLCNCLLLSQWKKHMATEWKPTTYSSRLSSFSETTDLPGF